jgi:uncharacterized protein YbjT (DUF2867 family)
MTKTKDVILVTGATGTQGGAVARHLLAKGHAVRAMTRKPEGERARELRQAGAEVVHGDLDDPASLSGALDGVWGAFAVQNTWEAGVEGEEQQGKRFAEVAHKKGVKHFVYTSVASAHRQTGIPHFENKFRVEETLRGLGFPSWTIIRPVFFMENWASPWFKPGIEQGKLAIALKPGTVLQMIAAEDIGAYGTLAFERHEQLKGRAVDIAGAQHTMPETAEILGRAAGRKVEFAPPPIEEVKKSNADFAAMLEWFDRVGYDADVPGLQREFGIRPTSLAEWAAKLLWS